MHENSMTPVNTGRRFNKVAKTSRNALLASTVLLAVPNFAWADEAFNSGNHAITADKAVTGRLFVSNNADTHLTISNGATVTSGDGLIAFGAGYTGIVTVTGDGTRWETTEPLTVGVNGNGELNIENGAVVQNRLGYIAQKATTTGKVNVSGTGSTWINTGALFVGNGTLNIKDGGLVESTTSMIGYPADTVGVVNVTGNGSRWIDHHNIYVGYTTDGTLNVSDGGVVENITGFIGNSANSTGDVTVTGSESLWINSSGLIIGYQGNGTLTISDEAVVTVGTQQQDGSYNGTTFIASAPGSKGTLNIGAAETEFAAAAGTLKSDSITFGSGTSGSIVFNHTDANYTFSAGIKGNGDIKHLSGVTTLTGNSANFSGVTNVNGGSLLVSNVLGGTVKVNNGGTIGGTGTIGTTTIGDGGILSPGGLETIIWARASTFGAPSFNQIGTLTVDGNLTLRDGSTYAVDLSGTTSDLVHVDGQASIEDGADVKVTSLDDATSYQQTQKYTILNADGGLTGKFSELINTSSAFLDITTSYDDYNAYLNVSVKGSGNTGTNPNPFSRVARTGNQKSLAGALDSLDQTPGSASLKLYNDLLQLSEDDALQAYQQLSGDVYATAQGAFTQTNRAVNTALNSRVRAVTDGVAAPSSMALGYAEEKKAAKDERFAAFEPKEAFDTDRFATWVNGFGSWGKVSGVDGGSDTDTANGGVIFGGDMMVGSDWRVGVLGGYSRSFFDTDSSNGASTNYHLGGYAGTKWGPVAFRTGLNYTWHNVDTSRTITALGETLSGDYDGSSFNAYGELAYRLDVGKSALEPFAALAHSRTRTDGFTETGGTAALTVDDSSMNTTFTTIGLRASTDLDIAGVASVARGTIGWMHAFGDVDPVSSARFATGDSFSVTSTPVDRNAALLEAGVDLTITPASTLSFTYNGQIGSNAYDHGANAKLRVKF
ncbi:autotransporter outer membrane beta-barrel domain-containing protein [Agrobacterium sp. Azo12]|uniref:autotransporter outer membrane beta-barrel domain-containing protein n=1 Tax=Agrobacterium sp. Azo12 TaxID=3031129 RepID=UPI0023D7EB1C|nr:autotransporter domain-containing protein [Agrobacterium sp. Azo12]MDO5897510.1 autotransporter domain-containing protein [Agrobacterium sp. Azo12]